jgi:hypothetical protein
VGVLRLIFWQAPEFVQNPKQVSTPHNRLRQQGILILKKGSNLGESAAVTDEMKRSAQDLRTRNYLYKMGFVGRNTRKVPSSSREIFSKSKQLCKRAALESHAADGMGLV